MYRLLFGTPLAKETMLEAVETRNLEIVKDTIRKLKPIPINYTDTPFNVEQFSYFNTAIINGDLEIIKLLIEKGLTDCNSKYSIAPLLAVTWNNLELLKLLLASGWVLKGDYNSGFAANLSEKFILVKNNRNFYFRHDFYPLVVAVNTGNKELIDYTFEQVSKNREYDHVFGNLLHLSVWQSKPVATPRNIVLKVLKEYPDKVHNDINRYKLVFLDAVKGSDLEIVKEFIKLGYDTKQNCREAALIAEQYYAYAVYGIIAADSGEPDCLDRVYHYIWSFFN